MQKSGMKEKVTQKHQHIVQNFPEVQGSGEQRTLLQVTTGPLLQKATIFKSIRLEHDLPNTETQRGRQNEETEDYEPNERIRQNHSRRSKTLHITEIRNMPD